MASASESLADNRSKRSQVETASVAAEGGDTFAPKPVHFRLLSAYEAAFQDGIPPTDGVIAKRLGVRRETINLWRRSNHRLRAWLFERIGQTVTPGLPWRSRGEMLTLPRGPIPIGVVRRATRGRRFDVPRLRLSL